MTYIIYKILSMRRNGTHPKTTVLVARDSKSKLPQTTPGGVESLQMVDEMTFLDDFLR